MSSIKSERELQKIFDELNDLLDDTKTSTEPPKESKAVKSKTISKPKNRIITKPKKEESKAEKKLKKQPTKPKKSPERSKSHLTKEVKSYENPKTDITKKKDWEKFKAILATVAMTGLVLVSAFSINEVAKSLKEMSPSQEIVTIYDIDQEERSEIESEAREVREQILINSGYHFDNISEAEFIDGYYRMLNYEKKIALYVFENTLLKLDDYKDQELLDEIVEESFGDEYANFSEAQKRDYRQLAFELLNYSRSDGAIQYIRNPIVADHLKTRNAVFEEKGYKMNIRVNNDEVETVRNLGNIMHEIHEIEENGFEIDENNQQSFFDEILQKVLGENYSKLTESEKKEYTQLIYEWLPDNVKEHVQDPLYLENTNKKEDWEIGE